MKIKEGLYLCPWCEIEFTQQVSRVEGGGKKGVAVSQCVCPECGRYVSQKPK